MVKAGETEGLEVMRKMVRYLNEMSTPPTGKDEDYNYVNLSERWKNVPSYLIVY